jgi:radical SAM-linked protein
LRYTGHLDFLRVFGQMLRRTDLELGFSQGFNPHILLGFALPLPLGMESAHDYADLTLNKEIYLTDAAQLLQSHAPEGLTIHRVSQYAGRGAAALTQAADYSMLLPPNTAKLVKANAEALLKKSFFITLKKTKSGTKETNIRGDIYKLEVVGEKLFMRLAAGSERYLNPVLVAQILLEHGNKNASDINGGDFIREQLYTRVGEAFVPLSEWFD